MNTLFARLVARSPRDPRRRPARWPQRPLTLETFEDRITPAMTLTNAGLQLGLSLTTFASGFPND